LKVKREAKGSSPYLSRFSLAPARDALSASLENHLDGCQVKMKGNRCHSMFAGNAVARLARAIHSLESFIIAEALDRVSGSLSASRHGIGSVFNDAHCGVHLFTPVYRLAEFGFF
jgi:hypothetical protein